MALREQLTIRTGCSMLLQTVMLQDLGLLSKPKKDLNGLTPNELNVHFAGVSASLHDDDEDREKIVLYANIDGFNFTDLTLPDAILAISHFTSQVRGEDGIFAPCYIFPDLWKRTCIPI